MTFSRIEAVSIDVLRNQSCTKSTFCLIEAILFSIFQVRNYFNRHFFRTGGGWNGSYASFRPMINLSAVNIHQLAYLGRQLFPQLFLGYILYFFFVQYMYIYHTADIGVRPSLSGV